MNSAMRKVLSAVVLSVVAPPLVLAASQPGLLASWTTDDLPFRHSSVTAIDVADDGTVVVLVDNGVAWYGPNGNLLGSKQIYSTLTGIAVAPNGDVLVVNEFKRFVIRFDTGGATVAKWGDTGPEEEQLRHPFSLALTEGGDVLVLDLGSNRVTRFGPAGEYLGGFPLANDTNPLGLDLGADGSIYVGSSPVRKYSPAGVPVRPYGVDVSPRTFSPRDLALDARGNLFVLDSGSGKVQVLAPDGRSLGSFGPGGGKFAIPSSVAFGPDGSVYVADQRNRISRFGEYAPAFPPLREPAIALHIASREGSKDCSPGITDPRDIVASVGDPGEYRVYVLATPTVWLDQEREGITGIQFGVNAKSKRSVAIEAWHRCAPLDFPMAGWPDEGEGDTITWPKTSCQSDDLVVAGWFEVSVLSPTYLEVIGYPVTGLSKMADCNGAEQGAGGTLSPSRLGRVAFGEASEGCNPVLEPCSSTPTATQPTTWGRLKNRFGGSN